LVSLARRDADGQWIGFLYRDGDLSAPEKGWANHATVMGYFLHRLKDGRSLYRGQPIEGGTHSFLRSKDWRRDEVAAGEARLTYRIDRRISLRPSTRSMCRLRSPIRSSAALSASAFSSATTSRN
jgi:galactose mutarotase-like enzyme